MTNTGRRQPFWVPMPDEADLEQWLCWLVASAEDAIERMYEPLTATGAYSDAKDFLCDAIGLAGRLGLVEEVARLEARLAEVKAVFRGQGLG